MLASKNKALKSTLIGVAGFLLLTYPLLSIANKHAFGFKIPALYLYVFGVWFIIILGLFIVSERSIKKKKHE